jgi:hypothetical protein
MRAYIGYVEVAPFIDKPLLSNVSHASVIHQE